MSTIKRSDARFWASLSTIAILFCSFSIICKAACGAEQEQSANDKSNASAINDPIVVDLVTKLRRNGAALSLEDFLQLACPHLEAGSRFATLWKAYDEANKGPLSIDDISKLIVSKQKSIGSLHYVWSERHTAWNAKGKKTVREMEFECASQDQCRFVSDRNLKVSGPDLTGMAFSYDGKVVRTIQYHDSTKPTKANYEGFGNIIPFDGYTRFWHVNTLLQHCMLFNGAEAGGRKLPFYDFLEMFKAVNWGPIVLERPVQVRGHNCIVVTKGDIEVYLDADRDLSLVKFATFDLNKSGARKERVVRELHDLNDYGNGIWFPNRITEKRFDETGKVKDDFTYEFKQIRVNDDLPMSLFADIIPPKALVYDVIANQSYRAGVNGSIEELLGTAIAESPALPTTSSSSGRLRWWVVSANVLVICFLVARVFRKNLAASG